MAANLERRPISVDEYYRMGETGILAPREHVELLRGDIVAMPPKGERHRGTVNRLNRLLTLKFADSAHVQIQCPVVLLGDSVPEPDVAIINSADAAFGKRRTGASDLVALLEVADSSRERDTGFKAFLYAEAGVREYWVVDLVDKVVRIYRDATPSGYRSITSAATGSSIALEAFPDREISVAALLPEE